MGFFVGELLRPVLAPLGAFFEDHVHGDHEQHDAARDAETIEFDAQHAEQLLAPQSEDQQDGGRDADCADRHGAPFGGARFAGQAGIDGRAARRVDHHEQGDEGRQE